MNTAPRYKYALLDHLGNAHILFSDLDGDGKLTLFDDPSTDAEEVVEAYQESHYYPFGMLMEGPFAPTLDIPDNYLYNTKEFNADFGLNWYDYGARWHDPAIGRWGAVDPLAEKYFHLSPYGYAADNPVVFVDLFGLSLYLANNEYFDQAVNDIISLVNNAKFEGKVTFNFEDTGKGVLVNVDFSAITGAEVEQDRGLSLLRDVTSSSNNYLYEVNTSFTAVDRETKQNNGPFDLGTRTSSGTLALNLSITGRGDQPQYDLPLFIENHKAFNGLPPDGFDAYIVVSPDAGDAKTGTGGTSENIPRVWFTFHELQEAYYRTDEGLDYKAAHLKAMTDGEHFYMTPKGWDQRVDNPYARRIPKSYLDYLMQQQKNKN